MKRAQSVSDVQTYYQVGSGMLSYKSDNLYDTIYPYTRRTRNKRRCARWTPHHLVPPTSADLQSCLVNDTGMCVLIAAQIWPCFPCVLPHWGALLPNESTSAFQGKDKIGNDAFARTANTAGFHDKSAHEKGKQVCQFLAVHHILVCIPQVFLFEEAPTVAGQLACI